jgi:hypothetical protein
MITDVIGRHKVRRYEQHRHRRRIDPLLDLAVPVLAGLQALVGPDIDNTRVLPGFEMHEKFLKELFVLVAIANKDPVARHCV